MTRRQGDNTVAFWFEFCVKGGHDSATFDAGLSRITADPGYWAGRTPAALLEAVRQ